MEPGEPFSESKIPEFGIPQFVPDIAPRVFAESVLAPLYELNGVALEGLIQAALGATTGQPLLAAVIRDSLLDLTPSARKRIARCAVCFVDVGFQDGARWNVWSELGSWNDEEGSPAAFPSALGRRLMLSTVTLAWTVARASPEGACILFGMTLASARRVSELGVHRIAQIAERYGHESRPAWDSDPAIWRPLLAATEPPASKLPPVHLRAMQRQLAAWVRSR